MRGSFFADIDLPSFHSLALTGKTAIQSAVQDEEKIRIILEAFQNRMSAFGRFLPIEAVRRTSALGECEKLQFVTEKWH
jgi:hypothetical protein